MAKFGLEILTPARRVFSSDVSEVLLPAYDGETGILPEHGDFVGVLGTGPLKLVQDGDDFWFMVSTGIYQVQSGKLTVFADQAESASEVDIESAQKEVEMLERVLGDSDSFSPEKFEEQKKAFDRAKARVEVHRRTALVN